MRKFLLLVLVVASLNASYVEKGHPYEYATLQYIRIGDNFEQACFAFKILAQNKDKTQKIEQTKDFCGFVQDDLFFGLESDSEGVATITMPVEYFGYDVNIDQKYVAEIAQDYLNSETPITRNFNGTARYNPVSNAYESHYYGYNKQRSVIIEITYRYITMKKQKGTL